MVIFSETRFYLEDSVVLDLSISLPQSVSDLSLSDLCVCAKQDHNHTFVAAPVQAVFARQDHSDTFVATPV